MKRLIHIFFLLIIVAYPVQTQRKEISQTKQRIKHGNNLDKAENSMSNLLKDPMNRSNRKIWIALFKVVKKQYEQGNKKLYLR